MLGRTRQYHSYTALSHSKPQRQQQQHPLPRAYVSVILRSCRHLSLLTCVSSLPQNLKTRFDCKRLRSRDDTLRTEDH